MALQVIVQQAGPLPIKGLFNAPTDAPMYLEVNGSVWSPSDNTLIGITVQVDNTVLGQAQIFSNGNSTHRAVVPAYFQLELSAGQHAIYLTTSGGVSDSNDFYTAVLHY